MYTRLCFECFDALLYRVAHVILRMIDDGAAWRVPPDSLCQRCGGDATVVIGLPKEAFL